RNERRRQRGSKTMLPGAGDGEAIGIAPTASRIRDDIRLADSGPNLSVFFQFGQWSPYPLSGVTLFIGDFRENPEDSIPAQGFQPDGAPLPCCLSLLLHLAFKAKAPPAPAVKRQYPSK